MSQKESGKTLVFVGLLRSGGAAFALLGNAGISLIRWLAFQISFSQLFQQSFMGIEGNALTEAFDSHHLSCLAQPLLQVWGVDAVQNRFG